MGANKRWLNEAVIMYSLSFPLCVTSPWVLYKDRYGFLTKEDLHLMFKNPMLGGS